MVAGERSGKTSFLRLLLDTSNIAPTASREQLSSVARFVQRCRDRTTHIQHLSVDVILDSPETGIPRPVTLTLIDTPSLYFENREKSETVINEILRHLDARFAQSVEGASSHPCWLVAQKLISRL
jgi:septin family protein